MWSYTESTQLVESSSDLSIRQMDNFNTDSITVKYNQVHSTYGCESTTHQGHFSSRKATIPELVLGLKTYDEISFSKTSMFLPEESFSRLQHLPVKSKVNLAHKVGHPLNSLVSHVQDDERLNSHDSEEKKIKLVFIETIRCVGSKINLLLRVNS